MGLKTTPLIPKDRDVISIPYIKKEYANRKRQTPELFPHAKYISIVKTYESVRPYKMKGYPTYTKFYGIGILTDRNEYYYSEITSRPSNLTRSLYILLKRIILQNYIVDRDTRVVLSDNIRVKSEGIGVFMEMMCSCLNILLTQRNMTQMTATINRMMRWVKHGKGVKFSGKHREKVLRRIIEGRKLDFITNPEWYIQMELEPKKVRNAKLTSAVGIYYLFAKDYMCRSVVNSPSYIQKKELVRIESLRKMKREVDEAIEKLNLK